MTKEPARLLLGGLFCAWSACVDCFNLETAAGRTQVGLNWRMQLGETRQRPLSSAFWRNEEQRRCACLGRLNWVSSAVTQWVSQLEAKNMSKIKCLLRI